eukprot:2414473-Lingulodinium_polyedra.AAC.1
MAKEGVKLAFSSFGQTKVVEDLFHQVRLKETKPGAERKKLSLQAQLQVARTAGVLKSHCWPESPDSQPGVAPKWDEGWFQAHNTK